MEESAEPRATVYDAFRQPQDRRLRRLPRVVASAFALVWQAARFELIAAIALQVVCGLGVAVQLIVGSGVLADILAADRQEARSPMSCRAWASSSPSAQW